jgi:hypothetical protein
MILKTVNKLTTLCIKVLFNLRKLLAVKIKVIKKNGGFMKRQIILIVISVCLISVCKKTHKYL